jgi:hypothetical protein
VGEIAAVFHTQLMCSTGAVQVGVERQEELPSGQVPQLAARAQRGTDHVCHAQDWPHGAIHERSRGMSNLVWLMYENLIYNIVKC